MEGPELLTLPALLGRLAMSQPKLVLAQGREYWRIEDALSDARRKAKSGSADDRKALAAPIYWVDADENGLVVVMRQTGKGPQVLAAEVGSKHAAEGV